MKEDDILDVIEKKIRKLKKAWHKIEQDREVETLHDYRSEMKKLKAFIRLLNSNRPKEQKIRIGKRMKDIYRITGDIRNIQLHLQRIRELLKEYKLPSPDVYLEILEEERSAAASHLKVSIKKLSFQHFSKNILDAGPFRLDEQDAQRYLFQQVNLLMVAMTKNDIDDEGLHETRKLLKDLGYNREFLPILTTVAIPLFISDKEHTDQMSQQLGNFHDLCVSLSFLGPEYIDQVKSVSERETLNEIKKEVFSRYTQLKNSLFESLKVYAF